MTERERIPFRFECIGSFIRPPELADIRAKHSSGDATDDELRSAEDEAIRELVDKKISLGLRSVTDGEFRREYWNLDFLWRLHGVERLEDRRAYRASVINNSATQLTDRIEYDPGHPLLEHYKFLADYSAGRAIAKMGIPSPNQLIIELARTVKNNNVRSIYGNDRIKLFDDIIEAYSGFIRDLYALGCRNLQMDDCSWCYLCSRDWLAMAEELLGLGKEEITERWLYLTNTLLEEIPEDMTVVEHICSGPFYYEWAQFRGYERIAQTVLPNLKFDGLQLRLNAGPVDVIKNISDGKIISLGLIDSYVGYKDDRNRIVGLIREAAENHPLENLCLSTSCGFEPNYGANTYGIENQWEKIELMRSIKEEIWG